MYGLESLQAPFINFPHAVLHDLRSAQPLLEHGLTSGYARPATSDSFRCNRLIGQFCPLNTRPIMGPVVLVPPLFAPDYGKTTAWAQRFPHEQTDP